MEVIAPQVGMSFDEFIEEFAQQPFELLAGERVIRMPDVWGPMRVTLALYNALFLFLEQHLLGRVVMEVTFILPGTYTAKWVTESRIPDIMYFAGTRLEDYEHANPDANARPLEIVPDFVAEIVSPNDKYSAIHQKVDLYLQDGVRMIWVIDPQRRKATVYMPGQPPLMVADSDLLRGGDVMPGFEIQLARLLK
ncbi:MAG: Uma2 family endonuclease [Chloroflexota bacterium]|nr:Uma2 family endonuclease [Chloroflexota bacterium]